MRFGASLLGVEPTIGHFHHRQEAPFCRIAQNLVDNRPAQSKSDSVYTVVRGLGPDTVTQWTDAVQDELDLGCYPVAGIALQQIDPCCIVEKYNFIYCINLQQIKL